VRVELNHEKGSIFIPSNQKLEIQKTIKGNPLRVHALQWPLLPADFVHSMVVVALKASGQAIFDNLFYEYGFFFVQELAKMKANVVMANPVTVLTS
jgi:UDP-N-acetylglucosamine enolpyruvyl transferase